jgi:hypothetical protein
MLSNRCSAYGRGSYALAGEQAGRLERARGGACEAACRSVKTAPPPDWRSLAVHDRSGHDRSLSEMSVTSSGHVMPSVASL